MFSRVFGKKNVPEPVMGPAQAIQRLRETQDMLTKKQLYLEKNIEEELKIARTNANKNKRVAIMALKKKKRYEEQLKQVDGTLTSIDLQLAALESASMNTEVLTRMKEAAKTLQIAHRNLDVDQVHDVMEEIAEQQEIAQEISDAIANPIGMGAQYDDDDLLAELEEFEQEELDERLLTVEPLTLPSVPTAEPKGTTLPNAPASKLPEDDELAELEKWAAQ